MLKFFRKIRQNLLNQGKTSRYFKYAIGEIVLVVIGILIAFNINRWNENLKNRHIVEDYYCRFLADMNQDKATIYALIAESQLRLKKSNELLAELAGESPKKDKSINLMLESTAKITFTFNPISAGYDDLKSSGNLNTFTDQIIVDRVGTYLEETRGLSGNIHNNGLIALNEMFEIDDLYEIGFIDNSFMKGGIDSTLVKRAFFDKNPLTPSQQKQLKHLASVLIAINYRNFQHYQSILAKIETVKPMLETKCQLL